jgi:hypothetical protein
MIIIRETFVAKPGQASKLAKMFLEGTKAIKRNSRIMTDLTGDFNTVVMETEFANLAASEVDRERYRQDKSLREKLAGYTELYLHGRREIFEVLE